jgi:hypothetical protein
MAHHILAIYDSANEASLAVDRLLENGVPQSALSVVASEG